MANQLPKIITENFTHAEQNDIVNALMGSEYQEISIRVSPRNVYCSVGGKVIVRRSSYSHVLEMGGLLNTKTNG